jgi:predicted metal-binding membrane protein
MRDATPAFERLLRRDNAIALVALVLLWMLAWRYLAGGAGVIVAAPPTTADMGSMPGMTGMPDTDAAPSWLLVAGMWWVMMVAMMTPGAAPTILLYARVHRHAQARAYDGERAGAPPLAAFAAGYFLAWLLFSLGATALQLLLQRSGLLSAATLAAQARWLSGGLLVLTGVYQLSPWRNACLVQCRSPATFLARHWRPGARGALRLGVLHGAWCIGCCGMLMALLFVGGVMNLAWIAALSLLVLAEKWLPAGPRLAQAAGIVLVAWGCVVLFSH